MVSPGREALEHRLTHLDLDHTPDDGNRYEVIDGVLHASPFPTTRHQHAIAQLLYVMQNFVLPRTLGKVFPPGLKVVLDEPTGVGPDLIYISTDRLSGLKEDGFYGAPDLIVEVLSSKPMLDRIVKLNKYAAAGVPHYWVVDPAERRLDAYRLSGNRYELIAERRGPEKFEPELFSGLSIHLQDLWL